jgi:hypothetical protein
MSKIIQRSTGPIDERLSLKNFIAEARKQANATPQEIVEDGVVYELFDCKQVINGFMNSTLLFYKEKQSN